MLYSIQRMRQISVNWFSVLQPSSAWSLFVGLLCQRGVAEERIHSRAVCGQSFGAALHATSDKGRIFNLETHITELSAGYFEARLV
jgi:hypothetical protein